MAAYNSAVILVFRPRNVRHFLSRSLAASFISLPRLSLQLPAHASRWISPGWCNKCAWSSFPHSAIEKRAWALRSGKTSGWGGSLPLERYYQNKMTASLLLFTNLTVILEIWIKWSAGFKYRTSTSASERQTKELLDKINSQQYLKLLLVLACVRIIRLTRDMRLAVQLLTVHLLPPVTIQIMKTKRYGPRPFWEADNHSVCLLKNPVFKRTRHWTPCRIQFRPHTLFPSHKSSNWPAKILNLYAFLTILMWGSRPPHLLQLGILHYLLTWIKQRKISVWNQGGKFRMAFEIKVLTRMCAPSTGGTLDKSTHKRNCDVLPYQQLHVSVLIWNSPQHFSVESWADFT